ncbi:MAG: YdcF family protein [Fibrobacterota bacterium]|nr:YdcF family protein [Fibrobacterota bacterium]QQS06368.1 MAG: YdcF family protein [Fibrobacterota bacterium]
MRPSVRGAVAVAGTVLGLWALVSLWHAGFRSAPTPSKARYAFVMDGQGPSGVRVPHALVMLRAGVVDSVVVSGSPVGSDVHYSTVWVRELELSASERGRILELRSRSRSTQDEARLADSVFAALGADSVIVVTSDYHAWRTASTYRTVARGKTVFSFEAAADPFWAMGWFDRGGAKMRAEEWAKRITWTLVECWLVGAQPLPVNRLVRGEEVGTFQPPKWK